MKSTWIDSTGMFLGSGCPLPTAEPFTAATAEGLGVPRRVLRELTSEGLVRRMLRGVYVATNVVETMDLRAQAVGLVLPPGGVVVDRTAAWLHGVDILARSAVYEPPPTDVFLTRDARMRRSQVRSGRRGLRARDVMEVGGVPVTTPLRTSVDLARLLWRFDALGAVDGFLGYGVPHEEMVAELARFRGFRGICQARDLVRIGDGRSESPGESALRLHWYDAGLPRPELQIWVYDDDGNPIYRLDMGLPDLAWAAEYDGFAAHEGREDEDAERRDWCREHRGWAIDAYRRNDVFARGARAAESLAAGFRKARQRVRWEPRRP